MTINLIGTTVDGRFLIENLIGKGGYGNVFKAKQYGINRNVAIKILHQHLLKSDIAAKRFAREARLTSKIRHENAVTIYDFGIDGNTIFLVMEYLQGQTLKDFLRERGILSPMETAKIGSKIANALHAAHSLGVIHRDLKPGNIIMTTINGKLEPVVIDFGLAKLFIQYGENEENTLTESNILIGTPKYMPPEMIQGETLDNRTDLYSLGIILYELLTGSTPFKGKTPMIIAAKHVTEQHKPINNLIDSPIPKKLELIIDQMLQKKKHKRPENAQIVANSLMKIYENQNSKTQKLATSPFQLKNSSEKIIFSLFSSKIILLVIVIFFVIIAVFAL